MTLRDVLRLTHGTQTLVRCDLDDRPVEVGSASGCDLAVPSRAVAPRALLVCPLFGSVFVYDLGEAPGLGERRPMPLDEPIALGGGYRVTREKAARSEENPRTRVLPRVLASHAELELVTNEGSPLSRIELSSDPRSIGAAPDNDVMLRDDAVSRYHCRIEPSSAGIAVRDLGSTNGTWVDGARAQRTDLRVGSTLRLGRSSLRLVERDRDRREGLVVSSSQMREVVAEVDRVASLPWPVLVRGETGVGKELVARAIHRRGSRKEGPFVALNMGGLPRELVESELFGHERGAFTGAVQRRRGAFEQADGGTLFLDEVAELPLLLQTRLLRVLETQRVRRLGSEASRAIDVRVVCATHTDLREAVQARAFREDLFYRIHRLVLVVPPLRERKSDISLLAEHLLRLMQPELGVAELSNDALQRLCAHRWPGNVRELRNVLEVAALESAAGLIDSCAVERALRRTGDLGGPPLTGDAVRDALAHYDGNVAATARALGMPRSTLRDRMKAEGIER